MTDRRDQYICAALTGLLANSDTEGAMQDIAADAVNLAGAALAAAGEKEPRGFDIGAHLAASCAALLKRAEDAEAEIARLRVELARYTEPLTKDQWGQVYDALHVGHDHITTIDEAILKVRGTA